MTENIKKHTEFAKIWLILMIVGGVISVIASLILLLITPAQNFQLGLVTAVSILMIGALLELYINWKMYAFYVIVVIASFIFLINVIFVGPIALLGFIGVLILYLALKGEWDEYEQPSF
jgi:hypothetical protein